MFAMQPKLLGRGFDFRATPIDYRVRSPLQIVVIIMNKIDRRGQTLVLALSGGSEEDGRARDEMKRNGAQFLGQQTLKAILRNATE